MFIIRHFVWLSVASRWRKDSIFVSRQHHLKQSTWHCRPFQKDVIYLSLEHTMRRVNRR